MKAIRRTASWHELAYFLEKHIGKNPSATHCKDAYDALLARHPEDRARLLVITNGALSGDDYCHAIRNLIDALGAGAFD